jgi:hypothetical protein
MQSMKTKSLASGVLSFCGSWLVPALVFAQVAPTAGSPSSPAGSGNKPAASAAPSSSPAPASADASAAEPSLAVVTEAKQRFDRGLDLYAEGEYPLALIEFTRAYELVPNYRVLYNIGQVGIQLGQYANARRALEEYLTKGGGTIAPDRRAAVDKDLEMLERRTAFLDLTVNVEGAEVLVDDIPVGKTPLGPALLVDAGVHRIAIRRTGYQQRNQQVTLAGGDRQAISLTLEKQMESKSTIVVRDRVVEDDSTLMIAGWVATGALTAGAIVTGLMGAGEAKELKDLKASDPRDYDDFSGRLDSAKSNASSLFLASDVFSGAALIVGGLSLWVTLSPADTGHEVVSPDKPSPTEPTRPLQVGYQEGQFKLRGSF